MTRTLHLRCGTDIKDALRVAKIPGAFAEYGDPICEGPALAPIGTPEFIEHRVRFMKTHWQIEPEATRARFAKQNALLQELDDYERLVLWFEHDLFDQCILIQLLAELPGPTLDKAELICIGHFPGLTRFIGLGQLSPQQLASLAPQARPLTPEHQHVAKFAQEAWTAPSPKALETLLDPAACGPLEFLASAVERHLQELPWSNSGLGLTDQYILRAVAQGASHALAAFECVHQTLETSPFLGDLMFWAHLHELSRGLCPALNIHGEFPIETLELTPHGIALVEGKKNHLHANGITDDSLYRWRGGIEQDCDRGWVYTWDNSKKSALKSPV